MRVEYDRYMIVCMLLSVTRRSYCLQCFQCDSVEDNLCPSDKTFDENINALVDCSSFEAKTPGRFCMKMLQQSMGWGGWTKITRRCGSRAGSSLAWGCKGGYDINGIWWETCYCNDRDGCNEASSVIDNHLVSLVVVMVSVIWCVSA